MIRSDEDLAKRDNLDASELNDLIIKKKALTHAWIFGVSRGYAQDEVNYTV